MTEYIDLYGNRCGRMLAPAGRVTMSDDIVVVTSGLPDPQAPDAAQHRVEDLPDDVVSARYCTGYLGDIGVPAAPPMDFSAWLEVLPGRAWHVFDARNNVPRVGRVLMARGRDAADVALTTTFGLSRLDEFTVWADELPRG